MSLEIIENDELLKSWNDLPEELKTRRLQVREMYFFRSGTSATMISKLLGVSTRTVERDLRWIRECNKNWVNQEYDQAEYIGESIEMLREVEKRCLEMSDHAANNTIKEVGKNPYTGQIETNQHLSPDYNAHRSNIETAMKARAMQLKILQAVGMLGTISRSSQNERLDVSKMGLPELKQANDKLTVELKDLLAKIKYIDESPDPFVD